MISLALPTSEAPLSPSGSSELPSSDNSAHRFEKFVCMSSKAFFETSASASAVDHSFSMVVDLFSNSSSFLVVAFNCDESSRYKSDRFTSSFVGISDATLSSFSIKSFICFICSSFSDINFLIRSFLEEASVFKSANSFFSFSTSFVETCDFSSPFSVFVLSVEGVADDDFSSFLTPGVLVSIHAAADSLSSSAFATAFRTSFKFTRRAANRYSPRRTLRSDSTISSLDRVNSVTSSCSVMFSASTRATLFSSSETVVGFQFSPFV
mmetsp:Transcript_19040/g.47303  ORF Transcript_19040/g.47303 Transcript_19040/m.47303 type:complete len:266 (+) Transcript_19040:556-1353(+)